MGRAREIIQLLKKEYPHAKIALNYKTPWQLLVAVVLSAQCTDVLVNKVTKTLFKKYKTLDDYVNAGLQIFEHDIKSIGFYHGKAKNILAAATIIKEKYDGNVPKSMEELLSLPGVGRKTANVVLGNAFGIVEGIAVDTHVHRISQRLRLVDLKNIGGKNVLTFVSPERSRRIDFKKDADPNKIEKELMAVVSKSDWFHFTHLIQSHGRSICKSLRPDCTHCVLNALCAASRV